MYRSGIYSSFTPRTISIGFVSVDIVCLVVQATGGALAGTSITPDQADEGAEIMSGGILLQRESSRNFPALRPSRCSQWCGVSSSPDS